MNFCNLKNVNNDNESTCNVNIYVLYCATYKVNVDHYND